MGFDIEHECGRCGGRCSYWIIQSGERLVCLACISGGSRCTSVLSQCTFFQERGFCRSCLARNAVCAEVLLCERCRAKRPPQASSRTPAERAARQEKKRASVALYKAGVPREKLPDAVARYMRNMSLEEVVAEVWADTARVAPA